MNKTRAVFTFIALQLCSSINRGTLIARTCTSIVLQLTKRSGKRISSRESFVKRVAFFCLKGPRNRSLIRARRAQHGNATAQTFYTYTVAVVFVQKKKKKNVFTTADGDSSSGRKRSATKNARGTVQRRQKRY
jgi:hypothetical protein